ncbi:MAG: DUF3343 domain-containing protein [Clostridia bacterium]|nr:DUF3343 domain-containing protein [Clostridia bacterium]
MTILAVFRSRSQSLDFAQRLLSYGIPAETVSAPKEARIGCGLCVRFDQREFARANAVLKMGKYSTFKGYYKSEFVGGRQRVVPFGG